MLRKGFLCPGPTQRERDDIKHSRALVCFHIPMLDAWMEGEEDRSGKTTKCERHETNHRRCFRADYWNESYELLIHFLSLEDLGTTFDTVQSEDLDSPKNQQEPNE